MGYVDEDEIRRLLVGRRIVSADTVDNGIDDTRGYLTLDDGVVLEFVGNEGCGGCSNGWYYVSSVATCENIITNVLFEDERVDEGNPFDDEAYTYYVFVVTGDEKINVVQVDGSDGNGYYGSGYYVNVKVPV